MNANPYDQLPYRCQPIEWTAPERLALASFLHGGPLPDLQQYRVLELGCGDGSNLLPLAFYRSQAQFVGVDGAASQIEVARDRGRQLDLHNIEFHHLDFLNTDRALDGTFDFIIAHGIFSWVPDDARDALFALCQKRLSGNGLLYLNYNTRPGWNVRGMVRDYFLSLTDATASLHERAQHAQRAAADMARSLEGDSHPFSQLMANEFRFVCDNHSSYVAHEFLAEHNQAYWRSEFMMLAERYGFHHIADADFNYPTGQVDSELPARLQALALTGNRTDDTVDLVSYRQLHSPIFSQQVASTKPDVHKLGSLQMASCLVPVGDHQPGWFAHPNGFQVETKTKPLCDALEKLNTRWPQSESIAALLGQDEQAVEDVLLLHRHGLLDLRLPHSPEPSLSSAINSLNQLEQHWGGYHTTALHQRIEHTLSAPMQRWA